MRSSYPFTAIVGIDDLALASSLAAVSPAIGGALARDGQLRPSAVPVIGPISSVAGTAPLAGSVLRESR